MITIQSVEQFQKTSPVFNAVKDLHLTEKELVSRVFNLGYTIRLGALKDIMKLF